MVRFVLAGVVCLFAIHDARAAKPVPNGPPRSAALGRKQIEAILQSPADLDFANRRTATVGELLDMLHQQHHLSILYDVPTLASLYRLNSVSGVTGKALASQCSPPESAVSTPAAAPSAHPQVAVAKGKLAAVDPAAGYPSTGLPAPVISPFLNGPAPPESCQRSDSSARDQRETESAAQFFERVGKVEVSISAVDGRTVTVATALRLALDAFPNANAKDSAGLPLAFTDASLVDFLAEDDCILITTRLKALTDKETKVYSLKNLKDTNPRELSAVICQSVRPWSWQSRIDDLGEELKAGIASVPPAAFSAFAKSAIQVATDATGITSKPSNADKNKANPSDEAHRVAIIGNAVATGLVMLAHVSLSTLEAIHYADPPTGSIRLLPGKLIITQSQAAHREIAELLKQLSDE